MSLSVSKFNNCRVLVAGDIMLDRYWYGAATRISPEAPVPVVHVRNEEERLGGAGNVALNIASLGANVEVIGCIGQDDSGARLIGQLEDAGIAYQLERFDDVPTITKLRVLSQHQQLIRLDFEDGFSDIKGASFFEYYIKAVTKSDVVILSDYGKGTLQNTRELIASARKSDVPVLVDPKGNDFSVYSGASLVTPNLKELQAVVGPCDSKEAIARKGRALMTEHSIDALLVTRGEQGMTLLETEQPDLHLAAQAVEIFDVTGAGDTVIAVLGTALAAGNSLADSTTLANTAAGIVVGKLGAAAVSLAELERSQGGDSGIDSGAGVMSASQLRSTVASAQAKGESVVVTNGCFDILHAGHVGYLQEARALGDRLVVLVNDDDSVQRLKGKDRPINSVAQRMQVLAALGCVDWVAPFSEDTPEQLIDTLEPDHLVKGGDYQVEDIAGHKGVIARNGKVTILRYQKGFSTSDIIESIRKR